MNIKTTLVAAGIAALIGVGGINAVEASSFSESLKQSFDSMSMRNVTNPDVYKSQTAIMFSGGSYVERTPVRTYQLASIQMPSISAGCGGISATAGGFSFIRGDELIAMMKNITSNATGVLYKLGIDIVSAQIGNALNNGLEWAQRLNNTQINSCEAATSIVGGGFDLVTGGEFGCTAQKVKGGMDWSEARKACVSNPNSAGEITDPAIKDSTPFTGNLVWRTMYKNNTYGITSLGTNASAYDLPHLAMSLVGTVIRKPVSGSEPAEILTMPSLFIGEEGTEMMNAMLYGGSFSTYKCLRPDIAEGCEVISVANQNLTADRALYAQTRNALLSLLDKIAQVPEVALSPTDEQFLGATEIPVWSLLASAYAAGGHSLATTHLDTLAEVIARNILHIHFDSVMSDVYKSLGSINVASTDREVLLDLRNNVVQARNILNNIDERNKERSDRLARIHEQHSTYRKILISRMAPGTFMPAGLLGSGE